MKNFVDIENPDFNFWTEITTEISLNINYDFILYLNNKSKLFSKSSVENEFMSKYDLN